MTDDPLFPPSHHPSQVAAEFWPCLRCGLLAWDKGQHRAWHASVDTAGTTRVSHRPTLEFFRDKDRPVLPLQRGSTIHVGRDDSGRLNYEILPPGSEVPP